MKWNWKNIPKNCNSLRKKGNFDFLSLYEKPKKKKGLAYLCVIADEQTPRADDKGGWE